MLNKPSAHIVYQNFDTSLLEAGTFLIGHPFSEISLKSHGNSSYSKIILFKGYRGKSYSTKLVVVVVVVYVIKLP